MEWCHRNLYHNLVLEFYGEKSINIINLKLPNGTSQNGVESFSISYLVTLDRKDLKDLINLSETITSRR